MAVRSKIGIIQKYLQNPKLSIIPNQSHDHKSLFFFSILGQFFIQGYRVFQIISNQIIVLSYMQYSINSFGVNDFSIQNLAQYKIINVQIDVIVDKVKRAQIFKDLYEIAQCIDGTVQINILYLKNQKYSVMNKNQLQQSRQPDSHVFFKIPSFIPQKKGYKNIDAKTEGTKLHGSIDYYIKGNTVIQNFNDFKRNITGNEQQIRFLYDLNRVLNTLKAIVGKEVFANDYWIMSSEKWMRKKTLKDFKRLDLILRNENNICIIDWKFSKDQANMKVNRGLYGKKNLIYFQLAKKDYKSDVDLKFYCIHNEILMDHHHKWSSAEYNYKITEVELDKIQEQDSQDSNDIVFQQDRNGNSRNHEMSAFFQPRQNKQNAQICLQKFKQMNGIIDQNQKKVPNKVSQDNKKSSLKQNRNAQVKVQKQAIKQRKQKVIQNGGQPKERGKRVRQFEFIQVSEIKQKKIEQNKIIPNKKIKRNQNKNWQQIISLSSVSQIQNQQILIQQLQQMIPKQPKHSNKGLYFDPKQIQKQNPGKYLIMITHNNQQLNAQNHKFINNSGQVIQKITNIHKNLQSITNQQILLQNQNSIEIQISSEYQKIDFDLANKDTLNKKNIPNSQINQQKIKQPIVIQSSSQKINLSQNINQVRQQIQILNNEIKQLQEGQLIIQPNLSIRLQNIENKATVQTRITRQNFEQQFGMLQKIEKIQKKQKKQKYHCRPKHYIEVFDSDQQMNF